MNMQSPVHSRKNESRTTRTAVAMAVAGVLALGLAGCQTPRQGEADDHFAGPPVHEVVQSVPERFQGMTADQIDRAMGAEALMQARQIEQTTADRLDRDRAAQTAADEPVGMDDVTSEQIKAYYEARKAAAAEQARKAEAEALIDHRLTR